jgi:hypothetical protein
VAGWTHCSIDISLCRFRKITLQNKVFLTISHTWHKFPRYVSVLPFYQSCCIVSGDRPGVPESTYSDTMLKIIIRFIIIISLLVITFGLSSAHAEAPAPPEIKQYAYQRIRVEFGEEHWKSFETLIQRESRWDCEADNPRSTAYGLGQLLDSTWDMTRFERSEDCYVQLEATIDYIKVVYKDPNNAWAFWKKEGHY